MKLRLFSDIHLEFGKFKNWPKEDCADTVLILAGDIGVGLMARPMIETMCKYYRAVVYITGNHEYYNQNMTLVDKRYAAMVDHLPNFYFLQNSSAIIDDVKFIGGTMWTSLLMGDWFANQAAMLNMNDFRCIKYYTPEKNEVRFHTNDSTRLHQEFRNFLIPELAKGFEKTVVITHHAPCELSSPEIYKGALLNHAFYENMTKFMFGPNAPKVWCHGHMHNSSDYVVGDTRIIANPRGYVGHGLNTGFDALLSFEI